MEKLLPALSLLALTLMLPPLTVGPLTLVSMILAMVYGSGAPWRTVLNILAVPTGFLLVGVPFLAMSLDFTHGLRVDFSAEGWRLALETIIRALAAFSCLILLTLTTPLSDWAPLLRRIGIPEGIAELILLVYRLIFVFAERALTGQQAQAARLGYSRMDRGVCSVGLLAGSLFQRSLEQARRMDIGLAARNYQGELRVLAPEHPLSWARLAMAMAFVALIGLVSSLLAQDCQS